MREKVGEAEKAGVDWTNSRLGQLNREVFELRRRANELDQLSRTDDPIHFIQVVALEVHFFLPFSSKFLQLNFEMIALFLLSHSVFVCLVFAGFPGSGGPPCVHTLT